MCSLTWRKFDNTDPLPVTHFTGSPGAESQPDPVIDLELVTYMLRVLDDAPSTFRHSCPSS